MKVALAFPWRETPDRLEAWKLVSEKVPELYPFDVVVAVDSGHERFNRGASRNLGVKIAKEAGADVVVLCDADSIPEGQPLWAAIEGAAYDGLMHFPFHEAWYVERKALYRIRQGITSTEQVKSRIIGKCPSEGGIWVCRPSTWDRAGGMDEGLLGWGCDDRSFLSACRTLLGKPVKHQGVLICLPHLLPADRQDAWVPEDVDALEKYEGAYLKPDQMKEVIDERRAYISSTQPGTTEERSPVVLFISGNLYL